MKEWDKDRELDGFLCRSSEDCMWADPNLDCQKYQIDVEFLKVTFQVFIITKSHINYSKFDCLLHCFYSNYIGHMERMERI